METESTTTLYAAECRFTCDGVASVVRGLSSESQEAACKEARNRMYTVCETPTDIECDAGCTGSEYSRITNGYRGYCDVPALGGGTLRVYGFGLTAGEAAADTETTVQAVFNMPMPCTPMAVPNTTTPDPEP